MKPLKQRAEEASENIIKHPMYCGTNEDAKREIIQHMVYKQLISLELEIKSELMIER